MLTDRYETEIRALFELYRRALESGLSLSQIEIASGISRQWSSRFLRGEIVRPSVAHLDRVTAALEALLATE